MGYPDVYLCMGLERSMSYLWTSMMCPPLIHLDKQTNKQTNKHIVLCSLKANWDGFHDNETGIYGYTWSVGSDVCRDDVSAHIDPHSHLFDESEWTHEGIVTGVHLAGNIKDNLISTLCQQLKNSLTCFN